MQLIGLAVVFGLSLLAPVAVEAQASNLRVIGFLGPPPSAGGLLSYAPSTVANYLRAAYFVDKILRDAKPGDLPVEQPTKCELVINLQNRWAFSV